MTDTALIIWVLLPVFVLAPHFILLVWDIRTGERVKGNIIGYKLIHQWGTYKTVAIVHYRSKDDPETEIELPNFFKPDGHQLVIWVKKKAKKTNHIHENETFFALGAFLFMVGSIGLVLSTLINTILSGIFWGNLSMLLCLFGPMLMAYPYFFANGQLRYCLPTLFAKDPVEKLTKQEYTKLKAKPDLLTYQEVLKLNRYSNGTLPAYALVTGALIFTGALIYVNWQNL